MTLRPNADITDNKREVVFQAIDWFAEDSENFDADADEADSNLNLRYVITVFGVTDRGNSITVDIHGFQPTIYIAIPDGWSEQSVGRLVTYVRDHVKPWNRIAFKNFKIVKRKRMSGFENYKSYKFIEMSFYTKKAVNDFVKCIESPLKIFGIDGPVHLKTWESNIDPLLRFLHTQDLSPAGWIRIEPKKYELSDVNKTFCQISLQARSENLLPSPQEGVAQIITASFDIEANSSHGDFPVAKKTYRKLAWDMSSHHHMQKKSGNTDIMSVSDMLMLAFDEENNDRNISRIYITKTPTQSQINKTVKLIESQSLVTNLTTLKLMKADKSVKQTEKEKERECKLLKSGETFNAGIERLMQDLTKVMNDNLPDVEGDGVIQIGTTFTRYGDPDFCFKHVICLDTCDAIEGVTVESYETEKEVLLAWTRLIQDIDPDVVIGEHHLRYISNDLFCCIMLVQRLLLLLQDEA